MYIFRLVRTQTRPRPGAVRHLNRRQKLTLISLALVDFMSFCSMSIMAPFFPREAALKGLTDTMCGLVFSFYAVVMFLTSPFFGTFVSFYLKFYIHMARDHIPLPQNPIQKTLTVTFNPFYSGKDGILGIMVTNRELAHQNTYRPHQ